MTPEENFKEICNGLVIKTDFEEFPNSLFFFKENKFYFELFLPTEDLWCSFRNVWQIFYVKYGMGYAETRDLIKYHTQQYFGLRTVFPQIIEQGNPCRIEVYFNPTIPIHKHIMETEEFFQQKI
jgi:hypothetical protein